jgi:outer membrane protein assembly factor BamB
LRWTYTTGGVIGSAPAIGSDDTVYFGSLDGKLYALNPDGTPKAGSWPFAGDTGDRIQNGSPAIGSDGTLYIGARHYNDITSSASGNFYAVNPDGTEKWHYSYADGIFFSSPAVGVDGSVYIGAGGSPAVEGNRVFAFNPSDGSVKWIFVTNGQVFSSPAIGADGAVYVGCSREGRAGFEANGALYALNPDDGTLRWMLDVGVASVRSSPALGADGTVYAAASDGSGTATTFYAVSSNGTVKWSYALPPAYSYSSPAIGADGTVYTGANGPYSGTTRHGLFAFGPGIN